MRDDINFILSSLFDRGYQDSWHLAGFIDGALIELFELGGCENSTLEEFLESCATPEYERMWKTFVYLELFDAGPVRGLFAECNEPNDLVELSLRRLYMDVYEIASTMPKEPGNEHDQGM